jgi:uncharacterized protein YcbK (DUF882 family)
VEERPFRAASTSTFGVASAPVPGWFFGPTLTNPNRVDSHLTSMPLFEYSKTNLVQGRQTFSTALRRVSPTFCFLLALFLSLATLGHTAESAAPSPREYRLRFYHTHTGERLDVVYRRGDQYIPEALSALDHYLRDHRTGDVRHFDPRLFDLLHDLTASLGDSSGEIDVICGYRTPWSNEFLRTRNPHTGVAQHSLHMQAEAIDIRLPGILTSELRDAALRLHRGGVGYYRSSDFVHVDVGRVRHW